MGIADEGDESTGRVAKTVNSVSFVQVQGGESTALILNSSKAMTIDEAGGNETD